MTIHKASKEFSHSTRDSACEVFGFEFNTGELEEFHYSWGSIVAVYAGPFAGKYDVDSEDGCVIFIPM